MQDTFFFVALLSRLIRFETPSGRGDGDIDFSAKSPGITNYSSNVFAVSGCCIDASSGTKVNSKSADTLLLEFISEVLQLIKRCSFRADDYLAMTLYVLKSEVIGISSPFSFAMRMSSNPRL